MRAGGDRGDGGAVRKPVHEAQRKQSSDTEGSARVTS